MKPLIDFTGLFTFIQLGLIIRSLSLFSNIPILLMIKFLRIKGSSSATSKSEA